MSVFGGKKNLVFIPRCNVGVQRLQTMFAEAIDQPFNKSRSSVDNQVRSKNGVKARGSQKGKY